MKSGKVKMDVLDTLKKGEVGLIFTPAGGLRVGYTRSLTEDSIVPTHAMTAISIATMLTRGDRLLKKAITTEYKRIASFVDRVEKKIVKSGLKVSKGKSAAPKRGPGRPPKKRGRGRPRKLEVA